MILIANLLEAKELPKPPNKAPGWWYKLTEQEQWSYFRDQSLNYLALRKLLIDEIGWNDKYDIQLQNNINFLEKYNPFYPKFGFSGGISFLASYNKEGNNLLEWLQLDLITHIDFYFFPQFFRGRFFINPEINIKIYESIGGGAGFNLGFLL